MIKARWEMVNFRAGLIANQFPFLSTRMLMRSVYHGTIFDNLICFQIILFGLLFFTFFRIDLDRYGLACKMLNDVGTPFVGMLYQLELLCHWYVLCSSDLDQFGSLYVVELRRLDGLSLV
jgi:hypothetical protein